MSTSRVIVDTELCHSRSVEARSRLTRSVIFTSDTLVEDWWLPVVATSGGRVCVVLIPVDG